ncbi:Sperm flagellar protein 1 [Heterocephalus glaber]|uniref:Sperm flagellar protein 1 n=1 Tax=Heterocephalus glaber TaxID=10181 RepID=G5AVB4_HETGA|nr:Sperm flagellar protein 1 [Heterocephalus glaber]
MPGASGLRPTTPSQPLLLGLCGWLDRFPLSRPKRHLARDFSDGVLVAEIVKHFHPRLVDLHNYIPASNTDQKLSNWSLLNRQGWGSDPGLSSVDADQPLVEVPTHTYTGLPDSPDPSSVKTLHNQRALKKMDCCACLCGDPAKGAWEHLARVQQLLEDKEQALAILQQIVQILQMKVVRLEHLVQLKDQRIEELMRPGPRE